MLFGVPLKLILAREVEAVRSVVLSAHASDARNGLALRVCMHDIRY